MGQAESSTSQMHNAPNPEFQHHISRKEMRRELRRVKRAHRLEKRYSNSHLERNPHRSSSLSSHSTLHSTNHNAPPLSRINSSPSNVSSATTTKRVVMSEEALSLELEDMGFSRAVICDVLHQLTSNANSTKKIVEPNHLIEKLMEETRRRFGEDAVTELHNNDEDTSEDETDDGEETQPHAVNSFMNSSNHTTLPPDLTTIEGTKKDLLEGECLQPTEKANILKNNDNNNNNNNNNNHTRESPMEVDYCKICMDREIDSVILKCGHVVSCFVCAAKLKNCPICKRTIKEIIKIYRS